MSPAVRSVSFLGIGILIALGCGNKVSVEEQGSEGAGTDDDDEVVVIDETSGTSMGVGASDGGYDGSGGCGGGCYDVECETNDDCDATEFCVSAAGDCGTTGGTWCEVRPTSCDQNLDPACGCDGITYDNVCLANAAGVTAQSGACP